MTLYQLADEIHRLGDVVFGVGLGEHQRVDYFLEALKSLEMKRMLMLTRPTSVSQAIRTATELFNEGSSVRVVTDNSAEETDWKKEVDKKFESYVCHRRVKEAKKGEWSWW